MLMKRVSILNVPSSLNEATGKRDYYSCDTYESVVRKLVSPRHILAEKFAIKCGSVI